jgi:sulfur-oxidizing protein SoxY
MNPLRRSLLKLTAAAGSLGALAAAGLLKSTQVAAAAWNKAGFESKALSETLKSLGATAAVESRDIVITAPDIAENSAVVPIEVVSRIPNTLSISIIAEKNPFPLVATLEFANGAEPFAYVRIKMGQTANVRAVVNAGGKFFTAAREVKITIGGCG